MTVPKNSPLSIDWLERMAGVLRVLAHPQRLKIVELLDEGRELPVHELTDAMAVPQATASQHLNRMRAAGLLAARRHGKEVWYRLADPDSLTILNCVRKKYRKET